MAATLTIQVTAYNNPTGLKYTLEGLVVQTVEDFDVIITDNGATEEVKQIIKEYCDEYVGFSVIETEHTLIPAARNVAVNKAKGERIMFIDEGDYISPDSVQSILKTAEDTKADIILTRYYVSGEGEPHYDSFADMLATVPDINRFDTALLNTLEQNGRVYHKKFFELYALSFPNTPILYNTSFTAKCVLDCGAKVSGCAGAIYDRKKGKFMQGFDEQSEPNSQNLDIAIKVYTEITESVKQIIIEETGTLDGDEYTYQEILSVFFQYLTDYFYRPFWYTDDEILERLRKTFEELSETLTNERKEKINKANADIRYPAMYIHHEDAAKMPMFSLLADFNTYDGLSDFAESLFTQRMPFFELYIRESSREYFPKHWQEVPNVHFLPDNGFFTAARQQCSGLSINVKKLMPLAPNILSELSVTKSFRGLYQYIFTSKCNKYRTRTYLKNKGLSMQ